jgi:RNA binding exosome subunit
MRALNFACSREYFHPTVEKRKVKGHFGNEITTIALSVRGRSANSLLFTVLRNLSSSDRQKLREGLGSRIDEEQRLHLRLDKQECFRGFLRLKEQDPIKAQFSLQRVSVSRDQVQEFLESQERQG